MRGACGGRPGDSGFAEYTSSGARPWWVIGALKSSVSGADEKSCSQTSSFKNWSHKLCVKKASPPLWSCVCGSQVGPSLHLGASLSLWDLTKVSPRTGTGSDISTYPALCKNGPRSQGNPSLMVAPALLGSWAVCLSALFSVEPPIAWEIWGPVIPGNHTPLFMYSQEYLTFY